MINLMTFLGKKSLYLGMSHVKTRAQVDLILKKSICVNASSPLNESIADVVANVARHAQMTPKG